MTDRGWLLLARAAGSRGPADLIMVHPDHGLALVQVGGPKKALGPDARERMLMMAELASALPVLARVVPRVGIEYLLLHRDLTRGEAWAP